VEAVHKLYVLFDPAIVEDAIHAVLFDIPNSENIPPPLMSQHIEDMLINQELFTTLISNVSADLISRQSLLRLLKIHKLYLPYLRILLSKMDTAGKFMMSELVFYHTLRHYNAHQFCMHLYSMNKIAA
jgi:hypothetical protein